MKRLGGITTINRRRGLPTNYGRDVTTGVALVHGSYGHHLAASGAQLD